MVDKGYTGGEIMDTERIQKAILNRNSSWENIDIPNWVNMENVSLDQYYTNRDIAQMYYDKTIQYLKQKGISEEECFFVEPSAGDGVFYDLLPTDRRVGIDICPNNPLIIEHDFLTWEGKLPKDKKIVYIGNPPFGYRGWLALEFVNKAAQNADFVFFILPMSFQSIGKGSPRKRVNGLVLREYEVLPANSFHTVDGANKKINSLWTVWEKGENIMPCEPDLSEYFELFTVDLRTERLCGVDKMHEAKFFLQRTFYNYQPHIVYNFKEVKYVCGYGFMIYKKEKQIIEILDEINWEKYSNLAAHNCHHISMCHIKQALFDGGLCNV